MAKIGINALFLIPNQVGGTEYHLRSFVEGLQKLDSKNQYVVFCNHENYDTFTLSSPNWQKVLCPVTAKSRLKRILYEQVRLPQLVRSFGCHILHSYGYFGPIRLHNCKHVVTVHDVNWRDHPEDVPLVSGSVLKFLIESCLPNASVVITDSEFSKTRLLHHFPWLKNKLKIIWPAIGSEFYKLKLNPSGSSSRKYLLCVSGMYPHKKILYLLELWQEFARTNKDYKLILVGKNGQDEKFVIDKTKRVEYLKYFSKVKFAKLLELYSAASAFIFPSVYEGFGYPVYEAASVGLPILVGNKSLYHKQIQSNLLELSFELHKDVKILEELVTLKPKVSKIPTDVDMQKSCHQLQEIYAKLA